MPRKDTAEYRVYMRDYMKAKRQGLTSGLTGINISKKGFVANPVVGDTGLEPVTFAMSTQCSNQLS